MRRERFIALILAIVTALWAIGGYRGLDDPQALGILAVAAALTLMTVALRRALSPSRRRAAFHGCMVYSILMLAAAGIAVEGSPRDVPILCGMAFGGLLLTWRTAGQRRRHRRHLYANYHFN